MVTREQNKSKWRDRFDNWYRGANKVFKLIDNFKAKTHEEKNEPETAQEKAIRVDIENIENYINEFKTQTSLNVDADKLGDAINTFQFFEAKQLEREGYGDGLRGSKDRNADASAHIRASYIYGHCNATLNGRIKGLQTGLDAKDAKKKQLNIEMSEEQNFYTKIDTQRKEEHRNFSAVLAWLYVIVGVALMFADFPISIGISNYFIDMPSDQDGSFLSKISNPETLLFSLGITFLSIYYKIIYDEYVNTSIITKRKDTTIASANRSTSNIVRVTIKLLILVLLLWLLYNIGNMRNALNEVSIEPKYDKLVSREEVFHYKLISFIFTTILLPLISGICLSVGFNIFANRRNIKLSKKTLEKLNTQNAEIDKEIIFLQTVKHMLQTLLTEWSIEQRKIEELTKLFVNAYNRGYNRAHTTKYGDVYIKAHVQYLDHLNHTNNEKNKTGRGSTASTVSSSLRA